MSAFVVEPSTVNRIVALMEIDARSSNGRAWNVRPILSALGANDFHSADVGRALADLNIAAVKARYHDLRDAPETELPGSGKLYTFRQVSPLRRAATVKLLNCYLYQCSEGDVPTSELYRAVESYRDATAVDIVRSLPDYEAAPWE